MSLLRPKGVKRLVHYLESVREAGKPEPRPPKFFHFSSNPSTPHLRMIFKLLIFYSPLTPSSTAASLSTHHRVVHTVGAYSVSVQTHQVWCCCPRHLEQGGLAERMDVS